jgi:hypothetical protein
MPDMFSRLTKAIWLFASRLAICFRAGKWIAIWLSIMAPWSVSGQTYRAYPGPKLPQQEVAVLTIKTKGAAGAAYVGVWVDGAPACTGKAKGNVVYCLPRKIEVAPGRHVIVFHAVPSQPYPSFGADRERTEEISSLAGETYLATISIILRCFVCAPRPVGPQLHPQFHTDVYTFDWSVTIKKKD